MATNNFNPYAPNAASGGTNLESQAAYEADDERYSGALYGAETRSSLINKALRQANAMASAHAQAVSDLASVDMLDDGTTATLTANIKAAQTASATAAVTAASGVSVCPLVGGLVPADNLPSYVDDVLEYSTLSAFPATGETGKIYVALDTSLTYRWSGSVYVLLSQAAVTATKWSAAKTLTASGIAAGSVSSDWATGPTIALDVPATDATLAGSEYIPVKQGATFLRTTVDSMKTYINTGIATSSQVGNYKAYSAITASRALTSDESGSAFRISAASVTITTPTAANNLRFKLYGSYSFTLTAASGSFYGYIDSDGASSLTIPTHGCIEIICDGGNWEVVGGVLAPNSSAVRAVALTGLNTSSSSVITAADTLLSAAGKLQAQISSIGSGGGVVGDSRGLYSYSTDATTIALFFWKQICLIKSDLSVTMTSYYPVNGTTLNISTVGAGGMDTGTMTSGGWLAVYAIYNPTTAIYSTLGVDVTVDVGAASEYYSGSSMPSGYTYSALIAVMPMVSGNIAAHTLVGRRISIPLSTLLSISAAQSSWTQVTSTLIPNKAVTVWGFAEANATTSTNRLSVYISHQPSGGPGLNVISANGHIGGQYNIDIVTPRNFYYQFVTSDSSPTLSIYMNGYTI